MNTDEIRNSPRPTDDDNLYHSDDGRPIEEKLIPKKISYLPSPSPPPAVALPQVSPDSSPEPSSSPNRKGPNRRSKNRPSQGDAVLVSFLGDGKLPEIAREAGQQQLPSDDEEEEIPPPKGTYVRMGGRPTVEDELVLDPALRSVDLAALAAGALAQGDVADVKETQETIVDDVPNSDATANVGEPMEDVNQSNIPSITATLIEQDELSPTSASPDSGVKREAHSPQNHNIQPDGTVVKATIGELPPILTNSPTPNIPNGSGNGIKLPSILDTIGDLNHLPEPVQTPTTMSQSPPGRPPFPSFPYSGHGSPPRSPNEFRRELPSPGGPAAYNQWRRHSQADTPLYGSNGDYGSSSTETPSTDQSGSTPATMGMDRMSIDNMTNPQIGGYQCSYPGCTAQPFQTQYLLNSHANVHSSNRPHYCIVKGCPRSEGGKGFKRKNEMIRHGLVHDSPGYVCPFCPDREHKYPRPDNLQRHVRVHHVDKDKDDAQLRDVLSQRPEGPSRGRRRRGGTS